tara:strand:- start:7258 stop:7875 length:618 start_codon:yes stop_codon:yes gene_type:complete
MNPAITHRHVIIRLLNGPIYQEDLDFWSRLGAEWEKIKNHFIQMGMEVARDDSAGYAFLRQKEEEFEESWEDSKEAPLPRVLRRTRLTYHQTMLMILLREDLMHFEQNQEEGDHLYRSALDLREIMVPYYPELHDEKRIHRQIASLVSKFEDWGMLKKVKEQDDGLYRVERIIKAKLTPEKLQEVRDQIKRRNIDLEDEMEKDNA